MTHNQYALLCQGKVFYQAPENSYMFIYRFLALCGSIRVSFES